MSFATSPADREAVLDELILGRSLTLDEMSLRRRAVSDAEGRTPKRCGTAFARLGSGSRTWSCAGHRATRASTRRLSTSRAATRKTPSARSPSAAPRSEPTRGAPPSASRKSAPLCRRTPRSSRSSATTDRHDDARPDPARAATARTIPSYVASCSGPAAASQSRYRSAAAATLMARLAAWRDELIGRGRPAAGATWRPPKRHCACRARRCSGVASGIRRDASRRRHARVRGVGLGDQSGPLRRAAGLDGWLPARARPGDPLPVGRARSCRTGAPRPSNGSGHGCSPWAAAAFSTRRSSRRPATQAGPAAPPAPPSAVVATRGTDVGLGTCLAGSESMRSIPCRPREPRPRKWPSSGRRRRGRSGAKPRKRWSAAVASEAAFKQLAPGRRVLHLATHGFFLGDECDARWRRGRARWVASRVGAAQETPAPPAVRAGGASNWLRRTRCSSPGLAFAGANERSSAGADEDDGILTAEEVAGLDLTGLDWAVLSACETGLGVVRVGEGVFGLRRAFQTAGARTVIMSVWSVEDRSTRQWMRALYQGRFERGSRHGRRRPPGGPLHLARSAVGDRVRASLLLGRIRRGRRLAIGPSGRPRLKDPQHGKLNLEGVEWAVLSVCDTASVSCGQGRACSGCDVRSRWRERERS